MDYSWIMTNLNKALRESSTFLKSRKRKEKLKKLLYEKA